MKFGDILRQLIDENKLTQKQLGQHLNIAPTTIGNYVRNEREPDYATLKTIAEYFNVTTDYLLGYQIEQNTSATETSLLKVFRKLDDTNKTILLEQAKTLYRITKKK